ncbi:MAG: uroporphyrinogen decarboxylase [Alphaproteobacteria bacterium]
MNDKNRNKILLGTLAGEQTKRPAFWFMRQAGRYLPEYRELRAKAGGFLDLVYNPERASEVTIQPIRRFGMDAAILFSDILVIPQALGQDLRFETGEGPKLNPISGIEDLKKLSIDQIDEALNPVYETVRLTRSKLSAEGFNETTLIGFAGSPWTVACYMVEGGGSKTFEKTKIWAYQKPDEFQKLIDLLVEATIHYLSKQIEAGAESLQLFDSWSGVLDADNFDRWVVQPTAKIVGTIKQKYPYVPVIGFPREAGDKSIKYAQKTGISAIGLDFSMSPEWARDHLQPLLPVQGNLDPVALLSGGTALEKSANHILETLGKKPFIFNLGHGVIKETPPENLAKLCEIIRNFK